ncbi:MAG: ComEC/Rec2 family competence protein [bacterium]
MNTENKINIGQLPAFKLLIIISIIIYPSVYLDLSFIWLFLSSVVCTIATLIFFILRKQSTVFLVGSISIALMLSASVVENHLPHPAKQVRDFQAGFSGEIITILKESPKTSRLIIQGRLDTKELAPIEKTRILAVVFKNAKSPKKLIPGTKIYANLKVRLPKLKQLPNEFDEVTYFKSIDCQWFSLIGTENLATISKPHGVNYVQYQMLESIKKVIYSLYSKDDAPLVNALITGDKSEISKDVRDAFALSGTAHLLALSGFNTAIIAAGIFFFLGFVSNQYIKFGIFSALLFTFIFIAGFQASALRAAAMSVLYMFLLISGRAVRPLNVASFVLLSIIVFNPAIVENVSFQLSALAILSILILYKPILNRLLTFKLFRKLPRYIANSIALTLAATFACSPIASLYFGTYSLISLPANLLVVPIMSLCTIYSLVSVLLFFYMPLASVFASANALFLSLTRAIINYSITLPKAFILGSDAVLFSIIFSVGIVYIIFSKTRHQLLFRCIACVVLSFLSYNVFKTEKVDELKVIPRGQYVCIELPAQKNHKLIVIADRKPRIYPFQDFAMQEYLKSKKEKLLVAYNGNAGINLIDNISKDKEIRKVELTLEAQEKIQEILKIKKHIPQIIEFDYDKSIRYNKTADFPD